MNSQTKIVVIRMKWLIIAVIAAIVEKNSICYNLLTLIKE